jgi:predicted amidohydrolase
MVLPYTAACIQSVIREIPGPDAKDEVILENTHRILSLIDYATGRFGNAKLVVLPEFSLQGFDHFETTEQAVGICVSIPGPETDRLAQVAVDKGIFIGASAFEVDPDWPGRWFNTAFLIDPRGEIVLKYRKIFCGSVVGGATNTSPADVLTEYLDRYGPEGLFPVADTEIGRIGMMVCYDVCFPEVARALAMRGAEIILHPTGEPYSLVQDAWREAKHARAFENRVFLLSANHGAYYCRTPRGDWTDSTGLIFQERHPVELSPTMRSHGHSEIVNFRGRVEGAIESVGESVVTATIDIERLRYERSTRSRNFLALLMPELFTQANEGISLRPVDHWAGEPIQHRDEAGALVESTISRLRDAGVYAPSVYGRGASDKSGGW